MSEQFNRFLKWATSAGYDTAHTYDTDRSKWLALNPMTANLWKAWQACVAEIDTSAERVQKTAKSVHVDEDLRKDAERYRWLRERYTAVNFDWEESGQQAVIFTADDFPIATASCDETIDAAISAAKE